MVGAADHPAADYEDIDAKPTLPPSDKPIEMNTYGPPVDPLPKVCMLH